MILKTVKSPVLATVLVVLCAPILISLPVHADTNTLYCFSNVEGPQTGACDMSIDETVSVNNGSSVEAESADQAVPAKVGDTITWIATVDSDSSEGYTPDGTVTVTDAFPSQATLESATPSAGTYSNGTWQFDIGDNIPATLTIVAKVNSTGLFTNTVTLSDYTPPCWVTESCIDLAYNDSNNANNVANGYVNVAAPVVMTKAAALKPVAKAPNTGFGVSSRDAWFDMVSGLLVALSLAGVGYKLRQMLRS